jgi:hypothetical protein
VSGEFNWLGGDLADGCAAIVAVLSEGFGDDEVADHEKHHEGGDEEKREAEKMSCVFEAAHPTIFPSREDRGFWEAFEANN